MASLTFIKREMRALERQGHCVLRYAIQPWMEDLVDDEDIVEAKLTTYIKQRSIMSISYSFFGMLISRPRRMAQVLRMALSASSQSDRSLLRHFAYVAQACSLSQSIEAQSVEHLHSHFATNATDVALLASKLSNIKFSFTVHGPEDFDRARSLALLEKAREAKFIAVISSFARSQLYRWISFDDWSKVHIVRCAIDCQALTTIDPIPDEPIFVCVGRLCEQKGQLLLVDAAKLVNNKHKSFKLIFVGDGEMRDQIQSHILKLGLENVVSIVGWSTNAEVLGYLSESTCLVVSSFAEGLPVVLMEACFAGRPVVSTWIAGIPELVESGRNGWLVRPGDPAALATAMDEVISTTKDQLSKMGRFGRERVLALHDVDKESAKLSKLFCSSPPFDS